MCEHVFTIQRNDASDESDRFRVAVYGRRPTVTEVADMAGFHHLGLDSWRFFSNGIYLPRNHTCPNVISMIHVQALTAKELSEEERALWHYII